MHHTPTWQLGFMLPLVLLLFALTDIGLRFLPIDRLAFRGFEVATRYRASDDSLEPDRQYFNPRSYGELAAIANLPAMRQYRAERFTTDRLGYRNDPRRADGGVDALLVGSSFSVGVGNSDDETLAVQLSAKSGRTVYSASLLWHQMNLDRVRRVARALKMQDGLVIVEWTERMDFLPPRHQPLPHPCFRVIGRIGLDELCVRLRGLRDASPLRIVVRHSFQRLQNDVVLPNSATESVVQERLRNGQPILFETEAVEKLEAHTAAYAGAVEGTRAFQRGDLAIAYVRWLACELRKDNLRLLVVLVPHKYSVYEPLLAVPGPASEPAPYLRYLEDGVRAAGLPVVNLTDSLRQRAAADLAQGEYIYWLDDSHWTAQGIELAAEEIVRAWQPLWSNMAASSAATGDAVPDDVANGCSS
jgi:hypothetical protein